MMLQRFCWGEGSTYRADEMRYIMCTNTFCGKCFIIQSIDDINRRLAGRERDGLRLAISLVAWDNIDSIGFQYNIPLPLLMYLIRMKIDSTLKIELVWFGDWLMNRERGREREIEAGAQVPHRMCVYGGCICIYTHANIPFTPFNMLSVQNGQFPVALQRIKIEEIYSESL